jgi:acyl-coenzyme A thioesterase PaaI-like protein
MEIPNLSMAKFDKNPMCFGCGKDNPHSLKIRFYMDGVVAKAEFIPTEYHQGWPGHVHGGALMAAIDESIGWATFQKHIFSVTAKIDIRLRSMARIGEPLTIIASIAKQTSRTLEVEVRMKRQDDSLVAEATSVQFIVR